MVMVNISAQIFGETKIGGFCVLQFCLEKLPRVLIVSVLQASLNQTEFQFRRSLYIPVEFCWRRAAKWLVSLHILGCFKP